MLHYTKSKTCNSTSYEMDTVIISIFLMTREVKTSPWGVGSGQSRTESGLSPSWPALQLLYLLPKALPSVHPTSSALPGLLQTPTARMVRSTPGVPCQEHPNSLPLREWLHPNLILTLCYFIYPIWKILLSELAGQGVPDLVFKLKPAFWSRN